ncbi:hypothetical protein [Castellaniella sp.]|uniref:hypothetical protein n=1 Tax=Castellaniella sp. TaxID=1955812 RepID=UPI003C74FBD3
MSELTTATPGIPARRRIGSSDTTFIYDGGILDIDYINIIVAVSTAATAWIAFMATRNSAAPELIASLASQGDGLPDYVCIRIYPGNRPFYIHRISAQGAFIDEGEWGNWAGHMKLKESAHGVTRSSLPYSINVPSSRVSEKPVDVYLLCRSKNSRCAFRISLHTRVVCFTVKYNVQVKPNNDAA